MLIENVDSLKQWLVQKLTPICDAEPTALAKYVCALVRKEKPESELKEICNDQLDVFLQQKTKPFVDELFEGLRSKVYESLVPKSSITTQSSTPTPVSTPAATPTPTPVKTEVVVKTEPTSPAVVLSQSASASSSQSKVSSSDSSTKRSRKSEDTSQPWQPLPVKQEPPDAKDSRDGRDSRDNRERDGRDDRDRIEGRDGDRRDNDRRDSRDGRVSRDGREGRERRRRTRSRSISPRRGREMDERRRRYDERDRGRYSPERRYSPDRRYRRRSRSRSPRRFRGSPERPRGRSRSPRERDLREKLNRRSRSWSRPRTRSRSRSRSRGRIEPDSRGSTPTQDNGHYPAVVTSTSSLPSLVTVPHKPTEPPPPGEGPPLVMPGPGGPPPSAGQARVRCQNFDEKGFCMLGDLCPYDHGMDPVVVEDIGIPNVLSFPPPPPGHPLPPAVPANMSVPPPRPGFLPPGMTIPPPGAITLRPHIAPRLPAQVEPYQPEGYNPEAPAITGPPARQPFWAAGPPPGVPHPPFPQPGSRNTPPPPRRDLVAVPTQNEDVEDAVTGESEPSPPEMSSRIVVPAKRTHAEMEGAMGMGPGRMVQRSFVNPRHSFAQQARGMRRGFDFNRLGGFNRQQYKHENTTLEVRKIPAEFNTIAKLNEHFGKFGNLTNIQVKFSGDPCAALISYSRNEEAARAYHSSEPVFNNRFIKLFWHRPSQTPGDANAGGEQSTVSPASAGVASRLGPMNQPPFQAHTADSALVESSSEVDSSTSPESLSKPPVSSRLGVIPPAHKLSLNNLTKQTSQAPASTEKSIVYTTSMGNLKKTVFNQGMTKARATVAAMTSPTGVKPADFVTRIEAIKKSEEMKKEAIVKKAELDKQKQVLLEKQISQQKLLLERLEKGKTTLTLEEKTNLIKMLKVVSDSIDKLKFSGAPGPKKLAPAGSLRLVNTPPASSSATSPAATVTRRLSGGSTPALLQQTKKEILDTELDLMTKASSGEDTTPLRRKLVELTQQQQSDPFSFQAASMGLLGRGRGSARGRGASPWFRGRGRGGARSMSLDNRPKTLEVRGFELDEVEELKAHFGTFGEIIKTDIKEDIPCALVTFSNRKQAELAYSGGSKFKKKQLSLHWHLGVVRMVSVESEAATEDDDDDEDGESAVGVGEEESAVGEGEEAQATAGGEAELEEQLLQATEEEEDEDQESRAWRR